MDTERNLLFGVVALQSGAVDPDTLSETCAAWASEPTQPLADLMVDRGLMTDEQRCTVEATVARELASHGDDPQATLAATLDGRSIEALGEAVAAGGLAPSSPESSSSASVPGSMSGLAVASVPPQAGEQWGHVVLGRLSPGEHDARERYTLTHLHAKGGMGRVWLARDGALGRQIALKELRPDQSDNAIVCSRFLYEAKITAQLEHPGIVPVYELGEGDAPYYTMRFVRGRTLSEAIRAYHKKRSGGEADSVGLNDLLISFVSVCHAVAYAHSRGIIHRDLKGQNVVLGDFGEVIVLDWGLAKRVGPDPALAQAEPPGSPASAAPAARYDPEAVTAATCAAPASDGGLTLADEPDDMTSAGSVPGSGPVANGSHLANGSAHPAGASSSARGVPESGAGPEGTMQGQLLGTPAYMAPEQARARHDQVDQRTDVYGLGAILYEILAGRPPFVAPRSAEIIKKVCTEDPAPPRQVVPEIAPGLEAVCLKALQKAKADRYQTASELAQEVRRYLADEPVRAFAEPWTMRAQRWARRNRPRVYAAAAALIIATIAMGVSTLVVARERNEAEAQGEQARQAVHLLARGADIAFDDQLDPVQKEMLQDALAYYEKFTGRASNNPAVRLEHGVAFQQMGDIERKLGRYGDSETSYRRAIDKLEPLAAAGGDVGRSSRRALARTRTLLGDLLVRGGGDRGRAGPLYARALEAQRVLADPKRDPAAGSEDILRLGQTLRSQADLLRLDGRFSEARPAYDQAVGELGRAMAGDAKAARARNELALALDARGLVDQELGDTEAARKDFRRAVELLEALVAEFPTVPRHREALAGACSHLGWLDEGAGRLDDAEAHLRREVALDERLAGDFPDRPEYGRELARGLTKLGTVLQQEGQAAEAEPIIRRAIGLNGAILAKTPDDVLVRFQLGISHHDMGLVLLKLGKADAALAAFRSARAIDEELARKDPDRPRYRSNLADNLDGLGLALSAAGQPGAEDAFAAAGVLYEKLTAAHPDNALYRIHRAISMRNHGAILANANRPEAAEALYRRALALLDVKSPKAETPAWRREQATVLSNLGGLRRPGSEDALHRSIAITATLAEAGGPPASVARDRHLQAIAEFNLADLLIGEKRAAEAGPAFERSVAIFETLVAAAPKVAEYQHHFGVVLAGQGAWLDGAGKTAEARGVLASAVEHQRQAVQLTRGARPYRGALAGHLIALADVNRKLGAYPEAARLALDAPKEASVADRAAACLDAARALARLVAQLGGDPRVPQAERDHLTKVYLTRTVVLLRDAVDADPRLSEPIKADPDLKVLQSRPEFQAILNTLVEAAR